MSSAAIFVWPFKGYYNIAMLDKWKINDFLGPVVQSIVSLTNTLRGHLVKCLTTLLPNILKFFVEKMRKAFALQKLLTIFQQKILAYLRN